MQPKEMDQTQWVCYELPDGSYYYGEVAYLDDQGNIHSKDTLQMATNPKAQLVKHGYGIYIYTTENGQAKSKYEGNWEKDKKNKIGKMIYEDGSVYNGGWKDDLRNDSGKMQWANGNSYEGAWRKDRFEGAGVFKRNDGKELRGLFRCNYFIDGETLRNPYLNDVETQKFLKARKDVVKLKQKIEKMKIGFFKRIPSANHAQILEAIKLSNSHNRVPLIFASTKCNFTVNSFKQIENQIKKTLFTFDLREIYVTKREHHDQYEEIVKKIRNSLVGALTEGGLFVINLDESEADFKEIFYPDIKEFYDSGSFPSQIWTRSQLLKKEVHGSLTDKPIKDDFNVAVWTKFRVADSPSNDKIVIEQVEKRFESVLPLIKIDYIILT